MVLVIQAYPALADILGTPDGRHAILVADGVERHGGLAGCRLAEVESRNGNIVFDPGETLAAVGRVEQLALRDVPQVALAARRCDQGPGSFAPMRPICSDDGGKTDCALRFETVACVIADVHDARVEIDGIEALGIGAVRHRPSAGR